MVLVDDDRTHASTGKCENCERDGVLVRPVEAFGWLGESRGYHRICFDCFKPRVTWRPRGEHAKTYHSPA